MRVALVAEQAAGKRGGRRRWSSWRTAARSECVTGRRALFEDGRDCAPATGGARAPGASARPRRSGVQARQRPARSRGDWAPARAAARCRRRAANVSGRSAGDTKNIGIYSYNRDLAGRVRLERPGIGGDRPAGPAARGGRKNPPPENLSLTAFSRRSTSTEPRLFRMNPVKTAFVPICVSRTESSRALCPSRRREIRPGALREARRNSPGATPAARRSIILARTPADLRNALFADDEQSDVHGGCGSSKDNPVHAILRARREPESAKLISKHTFAPSRAIWRRILVRCAAHGPPTGASDQFEGYDDIYDSIRAARSGDGLRGRVLDETCRQAIPRYGHRPACAFDERL